MVSACPSTATRAPGWRCCKLSDIKLSGVLLIGAVTAVRVVIERVTVSGAATLRGTLLPPMNVLNVSSSDLQKLSYESCDFRPGSSVSFYNDSFHGMLFYSSSSSPANVSHTYRQIKIVSPDYAVGMQSSGLKNSIFAIIDSVLSGHYYAIHTVYNNGESRIEESTFLLDNVDASGSVVATVRVGSTLRAASTRFRNDITVTASDGATVLTEGAVFLGAVSITMTSRAVTHIAGSHTFSCPAITISGDSAETLLRMLDLDGVFLPKLIVVLTGVWRINVRRSSVDSVSFQKCTFAQDSQVAFFRHEAHRVRVQPVHASIGAAHCFTRVTVQGGAYAVYFYTHSFSGGSSFIIADSFLLATSGTFTTLYNVMSSASGSNITVANTTLQGPFTADATDGGCITLVDSVVTGAATITLSRNAALLSNSTVFNGALSVQAKTLSSVWVRGLSHIGVSVSRRRRHERQAGGAATERHQVVGRVVDRCSDRCARRHRACDRFCCGDAAGHPPAPDERPRRFEQRPTKIVLREL